MISTSKQRKKAQITLEFLTTYGWAFLVVLIVLSAFVYFGVLSPGKFTGKRCNLAQMKCEGFSMYLDGANLPVIKLRLLNLQASRIVVQNVDFSNKEPTPLSGCSITSPVLPVTIMEGEGADFSATCAADTGNFFVGEKNKADIKVVYYLAKSGTAYNTTASGDMYDEVQQI